MTMTLMKMMTKLIDWGNRVLGAIPLPFRAFRFNVIRKIEYKGCNVYVVQFHNVFLRFFVWHGELYQNHAFMRPASPLKYAKFMLGLIDSPYGTEEVEGGESAVLNEAMNAIDLLVKKGSIEQVQKDKERAIRRKETNKESYGKNKVQNPGA